MNAPKTVPLPDAQIFSSRLFCFFVLEDPRASLKKGVWGESRLAFESIVEDIALYLNRRQPPFTALNSWTGSLSTGLKSWLELHLSRGLPWGACLRFKYSTTPEIQVEISPRIKCSSLRFKCNTLLHLNRRFPGRAV
jgi:hypothetical protein